MISLKTLITIAPLEEAMRQKLLDALPNMSEDKKMEISELCWNALTMQYDMKIQAIEQTALYEAGVGKKTYSLDNVEQKKNAILDELAKKLQESGETGALQDAREELTQIQEDLASQKTDKN